MKFDFFTLGGRFRWEDIYNYQNWRIQRNVRTHKYRLLDSHNIRRESGYFDQCKDTLLKYIRAYELPKLFDDTVLVIHGFARTSNSVKKICDSLKDLPANIVALNYASTRDSLYNHAQLLTSFLQNMETSGNLYIINVGGACLLTRKFLSESNNFRNYKIARILDINPMNSGSDLAELMVKKEFFNTLFGPCLKDLTTHKAVSLPRLPQEIDHGIIFCPSTAKKVAQRMLARFDGFPFSTPPSEKSYAEKVKEIDNLTLFPLSNHYLLNECHQFISTGSFLPPEEDED